MEVGVVEDGHDTLHLSGVWGYTDKRIHGIYDPWLTTPQGEPKTHKYTGGTISRNPTE